MNASSGSNPVVSSPASRADVSALMDGELDAAAVDQAIDALLASDELMAFWADAHRAGDWLRSEDVTGTGDGDAFLRRVSLQLADEPTILAPRATGGARRASATIGSRRFWLRTGLPGASIAAALVVVGWVASPAWRDGGSDRVAAAAPTEPVAIRKVDVDRLSDYFAAHRDVTPFGYRGAAARPASFSPATGAGTAP